MTTKQQMQQLDQNSNQHKQRQRSTWIIALVIIVILAAIVLLTVWILSILNIVPAYWANILYAVVAVAAFVAIINSSNEPANPDAQPSPTNTFYSPQQIPPIIIQLPPQPQPAAPPNPPDPPTTHPAPLPTSAPAQTLIGQPPATDPRSIEQRQPIVAAIYTQLTQPDLTALVLTGIGGQGKSTLAALVTRHASAQQQQTPHTCPFRAAPLWLTINENTTFTDLAATLLTALDKPLPNFGNLPPQQQALSLFNALNTTAQPRLIVLDQFENLLDIQTGHPLPDRPGASEWLDMLNNQPSACRLLLTSRRWPSGVRSYSHLREYQVQRLSTAEGVDLLRKQDVTPSQASDADLREAVKLCEGHAFSLIQLVDILRGNHSLTLALLFNDPLYAYLWQGKIAENLLDYIYTKQLDPAQRQLLLAFSLYREPVPFDAALALSKGISQQQALAALQVLLDQHLLQPATAGRYQLHAIVATYAQDHFDERDQPANQQAIQAAHATVASYYRQLAATTCPSRAKRKSIADVHPLLEAAWHDCQAAHWQDALNLIQQEGLYTDVQRWGGNALLLPLMQLLLPSSRWQPEPRQAAYINAWLGSVYDDLGRKQEALEQYEQALAIRREVGDRRGEGTTLNNIGLVYNALGRKQEALEQYKQALAIRREVGDRGGKGTTLNNIGLVYDDLGRKQEALEQYEQALAICQEVGDRGGEGATLWNIGALYFEQNNNEVALACYVLARGIFVEVQSPNRDAVQRWIDRLQRKMGQQQFDALLAQVRPRASQIVEQALREHKQ